MSYYVALDEPNAQRLEALVKKDGLPAAKLIERIVTGYLDFAGNPEPSVEAEKGSVAEVAGEGSLFRWDEQKGTIVFAPARRRVFIINAHSWSVVEQDLFNRFNKGGESLLSLMGAAYGRATALDYREVTDDPQNLASYFEHLGLAAGWGKFQLAGDLAKGTKVTLRLHDCVFCGSRNASGNRKEPCHFIMGVCKEIADAVFGVPHSVQETKCRAAGSEFCEITIKSSNDSEEARWPPGPDPMTGGSSR